MNIEFKNMKVSDGTKFENRNFVDYDFTKSDLTMVVFENCNFSNCIFHKTNLDNTRLWCCFFDGCNFVNVNIAATTLGGWGGGFSNCVFEKCKFGGHIGGSYFIDSAFNNCKIKTVYFQTYLMKNIRFVGLLNDLGFRKFINEDIYKYQSRETGKQVENKIRKVVGKAFESEKVILENVDFSGSRILFLDLKNYDTSGIIAPSDDKHLLIQNIAPVARKVYADIEQNWSNENTKSWALRCAENYFPCTTEIISFHEFKHFENDEFGENLMNLFIKHSN